MNGVLCEVLICFLDRLLVVGEPWCVVVHRAWSLQCGVSYDSDLSRK